VDFLINNFISSSGGDISIHSQFRICSDNVISHGADTEGSCEYIE